MCKIFRICVQRPRESEPKVQKQIMSSLEEEFDKTFEYVQRLPKHGSYKLSNHSKLVLHGYYMQATKGECTIPCPALLAGGRAKWEAWHKLGRMSQEVAMESYINEVKKLRGGHEDAAGRQASGSWS